MDPSTVMSSEDAFVLGRKPVNIFTFTTMAMRMSVYWFVPVLPTTLEKNKEFDAILSVFLLMLIFDFLVSCRIRRTSVMFVSISFIVLMMISLAWLVFYYIQRFRYLHAKDRLSV